MTHSSGRSNLRTASPRAPFSCPCGHRCMRVSTVSATDSFTDNPPEDIFTTLVGVVKLSEIGLTDPRHARVTTGSSPSSWVWVANS